MGQCGCGDINPIAVRPIAGTTGMLAVDEYHGCDYCNAPIALVIYDFDPEGQERWVNGWSRLQPEVPLTPSTDGEDGGRGWVFPFIGQAELVKAAREVEELKDIRLEDYETLADLLSDLGLELLRAAMRQRAKRIPLTEEEPRP